jgi:hypothetical protein
MARRQQMPPGMPANMRPPKPKKPLAVRLLILAGGLVVALFILGLLANPVAQFPGINTKPLGVILVVSTRYLHNIVTRPILGWFAGQGLVKVANWLRQLLTAIIPLAQTAQLVATKGTLGIIALVIGGLALARPKKFQQSFQRFATTGIKKYLTARYAPFWLLVITIGILVVEVKSYTSLAAAIAANTGFLILAAVVIALVAAWRISLGTIVTNWIQGGITIALVISVVIVVLNSALSITNVQTLTAGSQHWAWRAVDKVSNSIGAIIVASPLMFVGVCGALGVAVYYMKGNTSTTNRTRTQQPRTQKPQQPRKQQQPRGAKPQQQKNPPQLTPQQIAAIQQQQAAAAQGGGGGGQPKRRNPLAGLLGRKGQQQ